MFINDILAPFDTFENNPDDKVATMSPDARLAMAQAISANSLHLIRAHRAKGLVLESENFLSRHEKMLETYQAQLFNGQSNAMAQMAQKCEIISTTLSTPICSKTPLLGIIIFIAFFCLHKMGSGRAVNAERQRIIRQLMGVHPVVRNGKVKRLADNEGISSKYQDDEYESYSDDDDEEEKLPGVVPWI